MRSSGRYTSLHLGTKCLIGSNSSGFLNFDKIGISTQNGISFGAAADEAQITQSCTVNLSHLDLAIQKYRNPNENTNIISWAIN